MPRVLPNNKQGMRGGHINQKRFLSMNEDEKANVARCQGIKSEHPCKKPVFRCAECGNYGCDQEVVDKCTEQGFKNDKCLNCGVTGSRIPVMEKELASLKKLWEKEIPLVEEE